MSCNQRQFKWMITVFCAVMSLFVCRRAYGVEDLADSDIAQAVDIELMIDDAVSSHLVDVTASDGIVTLTGTVDNLLARKRALAIAESIKGVRAVVNRINVEPVLRPDRDIRRDIVTALREDPAADSYDIGITVDNGVATLSGRVESWTEREMCAAVARGVRGLRGLTNDIDVSYEMDRPDHEIRADIQRALEADVRVDAFGMDVAVDDGHVTLGGTVGSAAERRLAVSNAWVAGVVDVDSENLDVRWWAHDPKQRKGSLVVDHDEAIAEAVAAALVRDPRVWSFDVAVDCDAGTVTLTGTVDSVAASEAAAADARNTVGVRRVKNLLKVRPEVTKRDADLAEDVRLALVRDPYVDRYDVTVTVRNSRVILTGTVDTEFARRHAEAVAGTVKGVVLVTNNLVVAPKTIAKSDWEIREDIRGQLFWSPYVDREDVAVSVADGIATLTGTVDSWYEYSRAAENALQGGAASVRNLLRVENGLHQ